MKTKEKHTLEMCPHCEAEVKLLKKFKVQKCPKCEKEIKPCSICELLIESPLNCAKCPLTTKCPECNGSGKIHYKLYSECCKKCNCTGKV